MINIFKKNKLPKKLTDALRPNREFVTKTKILFLFSFHQKFGTVSQRPRPFAIAVRSAVVLLAVFGAVNVGAAYADSHNISATNPLYPLKRYVESVRLVLADKYTKPKLQLEFANRRVEEIKDLRVLAGKDSSPAAQETVSQGQEAVSQEQKQEEKPPITKENPRSDSKKKFYDEKIESLTKDLDEKLDKSVEESASEDYPAAKSKELCESFGALVRGQSPEVDDAMERKPKLIDRFENCVNQSNEVSQPDAGGDSFKVDISPDELKGRKEQ